MSRRGEFPIPLVVGLIAGLCIGAAAGYLAMSSQISGIQSQVSSLQSQVTTLTTDKTTLQTQVAALQTSVTNLTSAKNSLQAQIANLTADKDSLQTQISTLQTNVSDLTADKANLTEEVYNLTKSKLVFIDLHSNDVRPGTGLPYLQITCYMCNVGSSPANDSRLEVRLYQAGQVLATYTTVQLGTIAAEGWVSVDTKVFYSGSALVTWNISPSWTG